MPTPVILGIDTTSEASVSIYYAAAPPISKSKYGWIYGTAFYRMTPNGWVEIHPLDALTKAVTHPPKVWIDEMPKVTIEPPILQRNKSKRKRQYGATLPPRGRK